MSNLCLGCMTQKTQTPICEHCGYDETRENMCHQLPVGTMLENQYLVGRVLGQGGFGITYIGWDQNLSIPVAIKEYYPTGVVQRHTNWGPNVICASGEAPEVFAKHRERFLKEARTLAKLADIPEIVQIRSFFSANETAYIVMEYVRGITLKEHLKKLGRPMTEKEALFIMEPLLRALQKVHEHGLIHRDISPDNIMLTQDGGVKLIDFGTVRYVAASGASRSTEAVLKPGFAPMEQYNTRGDLGTWTDVYAVCATFHYLLTGRVPEEVMERLDRGEELPILRARGDLSAKVVDVLERGMKIRVSQRLQTVSELYQLLYTQPKKQPRTRQNRKPVQLPKTEKPEKAPKKRRILPLLAAAAAVLAAVVLMSQNKQPEEPGNQLQQMQTQPTAPAVTEATLSAEELAYRAAAELEEAGETAQAAVAFGKLGDYRNARERSFALWETRFRRDPVVYDWYSKTFYGFKTDGSVITAGEDPFRVAEDPKWNGAVKFAFPDGMGDPEDGYLLALLSDGTVVAQGQNTAGQCSIEGWTDIVNIWHNGVWNIETRRDQSGREVRTYSDYDGYTVGLRSDGTLVVTDAFSRYEDLLSWTDIVDVCMFPGYNRNNGQWEGYFAGLKTDGTVALAGDAGSWLEPVTQWRDLVQIAAGHSQFLGLKADGTLVYVLDETQPQSQYVYKYDQWQNVKQLISVNRCLTKDGRVLDLTPSYHYNDTRLAIKERWTEIDSVAANGNIGLRTDGRVVVAAFAGAANGNVLNWRDIVAVCGVVSNYGGHTIGIKKDGTVLAVGDTAYIKEVQTWTDLRIPK